MSASEARLRSSEEERELAEGVTRRPGFLAALISITLPVLLMLARAIAELTIDDPENSVQKVLEFIGTPSVALLAAVLVAMFALGFGSGMNRGQVEKSLGSGLPPIATILLIVAAGGGFKHGQHLAFDRGRNYPLPNLFVSVLQRLGIEAASFGPSTGKMRGLEVG